MAWKGMVWALEIWTIPYMPYVLWNCEHLLLQCFIVKWLTCCSVVRLFVVCTKIINRLFIKYSNFVWIVWTSVEQCTTNRIVICCVFQILIVSYFFGWLVFCRLLFLQLSQFQIICVRAWSFRIQQCFDRNDETQLFFTI